MLVSAALSAVGLFLTVIRSSCAGMVAEHHGHSAAHGRDEGLAKPEKRLLNATRPKLLRFDTSGKAFLHNQDCRLNQSMQHRH